jgi:ribosome-associated protein
VTSKEAQSLVSSVVEQSVRFSFARSGGPGGQNVNKVASKVIAKLFLADLTFLSEEERNRVGVRLGRRLNADGEIAMTVQDTRDQVRNRQIALTRMTEVICHAMAKPKSRRTTRPHKGAKEARLRAKRIRGAHKRLRGPAEED